MISVQKELIEIKADASLIAGILELPRHPLGMILFAHGSSNSRLSPRNNYITNELHHAQMGTLLLDLLTKEEDQDYQARFDITLLTQRLHDAANWLQQHYATASVPIGLFGTSTGTAAALQLAASQEFEIAAVVSRGGRPDMAGRNALEKVRTPTLLIVGGKDETLINLNQLAFAALHCEKRLEIIPGANRLFEEAGKLKVVAALAAPWFTRHLRKSSRN